jgi:hypothetical protein
MVHKCHFFVWIFSILGGLGRVVPFDDYLGYPICANGVAVGGFLKYKSEK